MSAFVFGFMSDAGPSRNRLLGLTSLAEAVRQTIRLAIDTHLGERVDAPAVGSNLSTFIFRRVHDHTLSDIKAGITRCLIDSEPRIQVIDVDCDFIEKPGAKLMVRIEYRLAESSERQTFKHIVDLWG